MGGKEKREGLNKRIDGLKRLRSKIGEGKHDQRIRETLKIHKETDMWGEVLVKRV